MNNQSKNYKILLTGGGTGGSVAPLLAVADELKISPAPFDKGGDSFEFLWLGTKFGPEREMVASASSARGSAIKFKAISGGKWRRYFSFKNLLDVLKIKIGFFQAFSVMLKWRPNLVMSAGSFISVPAVWAAWILRVPVLIHQQDIMPGLANKLMAPFAKAITVTFEKSLKDYGKKAVWTGNPVRKNIQYPISNIQLNSNLPVVLILGGGTGAMAINNLVAESLSELTKFCQVIHLTGKDKGNNVILEPKAIESHGLSLEQRDPIGHFVPSGMTNYCAYEFLDADKMAEALKLADIVVTRAGLSFLTELSYLGKPSIIIPMPDSHQETNAEYFKNKKAAIVVEQENLTPESFTQMIKDLLADEKMKAGLSENIKQAMKPGANQAIVKVIKEII